MRLEVPVTFWTVLVVLCILKLMGAEFLLGLEVGTAMDALVLSGFELCSSDSASDGGDDGMGAMADG